MFGGKLDRVSLAFFIVFENIHSHKVEHSYVLACFEGKEDRADGFSELLVKFVENPAKSASGSSHLLTKNAVGSPAALAFSHASSVPTSTPPLRPRR
jgi:hypothetical protein